MDKKLENKLIMLNTVLSFLNQNTDLWQEHVPLANAINDLRSKVETMEELWQITSSSHAGMITAKNNLQAKLIEKTYALASTLTAWAAQTNNEVLQAKVDFPISVLKNYRDSELVPAIRNILQLAQQAGEALASYGVTTAEIEALSADVAAYEQLLPTHRVTVSERKVANEKLKAIMTETLKVTTEQLDRLMVRFKASNPDSYAAYLNARKIVDYGTRYEKENPDAPPATT